jgi:hypothetical protein
MHRPNPYLKRLPFPAWPLSALAVATALIACSGGQASDDTPSERFSGATEETQVPYDSGPSSSGAPLTHSPNELPAADRLTYAAAADPAEALYGRIVSSNTAGTLCPYNPGDQSLDGMVDNAHYGEDFVLFFQETQMTDDVAFASCTITAEIELPEGYQMGLPVVEWRGIVNGSERPVNVKQTLSFEGGETYELPAQSFSDQVGKAFSLVARNIQVFSPCGLRRVRVTATLEVNRETPMGALYDLEFVRLGTSWRQGTAFKADCSSGATPVESTPGEAGDWCGGKPQRGCAPGLICEYPLFENAVEGECIDPAAVPSEARELGACGGVQKIPCAPGLVCWRTDGKTEADQGLCYSNPATLENAPCDTGWPAIECGERLVCSHVHHACLDLTGAVMDACGEPGLPECQPGLYCAPSGNTEGGFCTPWSGQAGAPCGTTQFPTCSSTAQCVEGRCVDLRGTLGKPCGEYGCRGDLVCIEDVCKPHGSATGASGALEPEPPEYAQ